MGCWQPGGEGVEEAAIAAKFGAFLLFRDSLSRWGLKRQKWSFPDHAEAVGLELRLLKFKPTGEDTSLQTSTGEIKC